MINMSTHATADHAHMSADDAARMDAMSNLLAQDWWAVALRGVVGVLFGLVALLLPAATMLSLILLFAAYMLVDGVFAIVSAVRAARHHERWGLLVLEGIMDLIAAAVALVWPGITVLAFVLLVAAWALLSGGLMLASSFNLNIDHGRWWLALGGIASIIFGVLLVIAPLIGAIVLTWWIGAYAMVFGISLLVLAFKLRQKRDESQRYARAA
jgi:uncharacterized membrane protein HdeD (DUF308 family)